MAKLSKATIERRRDAARPTDQAFERAHMIYDAAQVPDRRLFEPGAEVCADRIEFVGDARREYLRLFSRCTDVPPGVSLIVQQRESFTTGNHRTGPVTFTHEWQLCCLFCRESLATLPAGSHMLPPTWWEPLHWHTLQCAALFILGNLKAPKPKAWQLAKDDPHPKRRKRR